MLPHDASLPGTSTPARSEVRSALAAILYSGGPQQNAVGVYPGHASDPLPRSEITSGLNAPTGIAVDASGNVYICNNAGVANGRRRNGKGTWTVTVYQRGRKTPFRTYTDGVWSPVDVAVASDGTVFIANYSSAVTVYAPGSTNMSRSLVGPQGEAPIGIAFDAVGNTYVSYVRPSGGGNVYEYAPGQDTGSDLGIVFANSPHGIAFDHGGNLLVAVSAAPNSGSQIEVFAPGSTQPKRTIAGPFQPFMLALSADGRRLFVADFGSGNGDGGVFKFAYPSGRLLSKYTNGPAGSAYGVAVDD